MHYFDLYFTHVHPYVPVLNKAQLYRQWNTNRESISPLLLEAIFAVAERLADEPAQGQQWIALASSKSQQIIHVRYNCTLVDTYVHAVQNMPIPSWTSRDLALFRPFSSFSKLEKQCQNVAIISGHGCLSFIAWQWPGTLV